MAEEMQGIMGLSDGMPQEGMGQLDPSKFTPIIEDYAKANPRQFSRDILGGIAEVDPAVADQFVQALASMQLPPDLIDAMQLMVDNILNDPQNYAENRVELIAEGVPEELLPEQFDPAYFAAFNMALDQLDTNRSEVPMYAQGGIINAKQISKELAKMGRGGDTMLAHITPEEARMLRKQGGSGTINPKTGLREYGFFKGIKKAVGGVFKSVGKAIKGAVKGLGSIVKSITKSAIGKIALTFAAVYFMGPAGLDVAGKIGIANAAAANAVNTFAGSALVNVASGQKIGEALKGAAISGALAGGTTAVFGGGVPGAPRAGGPAPVVDKSVNLGSTAGTTLDDLALIKTPTPSSIGPGTVTASTPLPGQAAFEQSMGLSNAYTAGAGPAGAAQTFGLAPQEAIVGTPIGATPPPAVSGGIGSLQAPGTGIGVGLKNPSMVDMYGAPSVSQTAANTGGIENLTQAAKSVPDAVQQPGFLESLQKGNLSDAASAAYRNISPSEIAKANPKASVLEKYGPMAALGLGAAYLGGAFDPPKMPVPDNIDLFKTTGSDLLKKEPEKYELNFGGVRTTYASNPYEKLYAGYATPKVYAEGGEAYPRKTGHIAGPGTGTSDSVPAMLSDGEFVFTAKAVRAMGNGSRRKGAKRMYALMKQLEKKG